MDELTFAERPHRRRNILNGEWVLVSPQRTRRPWQGEISRSDDLRRPAFDPDCYLCPGNLRAGGFRNPDYPATYTFNNDYPALLPDTVPGGFNRDNLLVARGEPGICRVLNFSPRHDLTLAEMERKEVEGVIEAWQKEFSALSAIRGIRSIQIFENKGALMGNSNPHPHCQIWAQRSLPMELSRECRRFSAHFRKTKRSLLADYLRLELEIAERVVWENEDFVVLVPFWAFWPFETLVLPRRPMATILDMKAEQRGAFAEALLAVTVKYDNLFHTSFPYSSGIHQAPGDGRSHPEWHWHVHFYPPLLRSATIRKFMVGYELLAEPQRDITPEYSAGILRELSLEHYRKRGVS